MLEILSIVSEAKNILEIRNEEKKAQDENTFPDILIKLAKSENQRIRKYVANNPNTPLNTLKELAVEFPAEVMVNIALDLLLLSNPQEIIELKKIVALSPNTAESILNQLKDDSDYDVRRNIAQNPDLSKTTLDYLKNDEDRNVRLLLAQNPSISEETLKYLIRNEEDEDIRRWVVNQCFDRNLIFKNLKILVYSLLKNQKY